MLIEATADSGMRIWHARPDTEESRPAVLLLHERYGPVEQTFNLLNRFVEYGFVVATPDLFHRFKGDLGPIERAEDRIDVIDAETVTDIDETLAALRSLLYVDSARIGIAGFCLSGRTPLVYAVARPDETAAVAIIHGGIYPRDYNADKPGQQPVGEVIPGLQCPVLGMFGEADRAVPLENINRFRRELERQAKQYHIRVFADTPHGWMDSTKPERYREATTVDALSVLSAFFGGVFSGAWDTGTRIWRFEPDDGVAYDFAT
jgi:carboxymethylenebutenolidase